MLSLIWKDIVVAHWFLWLALPLYAVQLIGVAGAPPALLVATLLFTGLFAFGAVAIEETQGTDVLWCSLPVNRRDVVFARYATTLLGMVLGLGMSWAIGNTAFDWISAGRGGSTAHLGPGVYAALFFLFSLGGALFLPCYFRLGAGKGLQVFSLIVLGLLVMLTAGSSLIMYMTGGADLLSNPRSIDPELVASVEAWVGRWRGVLAVGLAGMALLVSGASAALSAWSYERRDC